MKKIMFSADKNARVAVALVADAGLRPEVLGDYKGNDGLMVGDFPEMKIEQGEVSFKKMPTLIVVRPELRKARHQYLNFLTEEGCEYLKERLTASEVTARPRSKSRMSFKHQSS